MVKLRNCCNLPLTSADEPARNTLKVLIKDKDILSLTSAIFHTFTSTPTQNFSPILA